MLIYLWKMRGYPQFSLWVSTALGIIYLSHIVIIWEKILPISGHRPQTKINNPALFFINDARNQVNRPLNLSCWETRLKTFLVFWNLNKCSWGPGGTQLYKPMHIIRYVPPQRVCMVFGPFRSENGYTILPILVWNRISFSRKLRECIKVFVV